MDLYRNFLNRPNYFAHNDDLQLDDDFEDQETENLRRTAIRDRQNPLESLQDRQFRTIFGVSKEGFVHILNLILPRIRNTESNHPQFLTPIQKLAIFIDFLRTNAFQRTIGTQHHNRVSQSRACIVINELARFFADLRHQYVKMPNHAEADFIAGEIFQKFGFPFTQGIIDGTHVEILKPTGDRPTPERFYNRKGYYSINLMVVVDHQMRIRHFTARHCGSAHDARIFKESTLRAKLVQDFDENQPRVLIGDEGYACTNVLITPIRADRVVNEAQSRFNKALRKARITVEHSFGILKKRFPVLLTQMRSRKLENVQAIIAAAITLHNIVISIREEPPDLPANIREPAFQGQLQRAQILFRPRGRRDEENFATRNVIIGTYF